MQLKPALRGEPGGKKGGPPSWLPKFSWGVAVLMVLLMVYVLLRRTADSVICSSQHCGTDDLRLWRLTVWGSPRSALPDYKAVVSRSALVRNPDTHTIMPTARAIMQPSIRWKRAIRSLALPKILTSNRNRPVGQL